MMKNKITFVVLLTMTLIISVSSSYVNASYPRPWKVLYYPKKTMFRKADLIDRGCAVFIRDCPKVYKRHVVCARHYDGAYKTFNNYCEMEYENCNGWRREYTCTDESRINICRCSRR